MLPLCVNLAEQTGHWKGFSSMWQTRWDWSLLGKLNPLPHTSQWYRAGSLDEGWKHKKRTKKTEANFVSVVWVLLLIT